MSRLRIRKSRNPRAISDVLKNRFPFPRGGISVGRRLGSVGLIASDDRLEPARRRRIFARCPNTDPLSWREKVIPDLAGRSMFFGPTARRKESRVWPPKNRAPA